MNFANFKSKIEDKIWSEILKYCPVKIQKLNKEIKSLQTEVIELEDRIKKFGHDRDKNFYEMRNRSIEKNLSKIKNIEQEDITQTVEEDSRIYSNWFVPCVAKSEKEGKNIILPLRYRIRPSGSQKETPTKYNLYNARTDRFSSRDNWKRLFMKRHAAVLIKGFYEQVPIPVEIQLYKNRHAENWPKKLKHARYFREVIFKPQNNKFLWAPAFWDSCLIPEKNYRINSFAILTQDSPPDILNQGHDRSPVFPKKDIQLIKDWLSPSDFKEDYYYELFKNNEQECFAATPTNKKDWESLTLEGLEKIIME